MYVIAGICGVVAVLVFRIKPKRSFENLVPSSRSALVTEADQDADIRDMDLTKLSAAGCGLLLSTVVVMLMIGGIAAVLLPEMFEDRRKLRSIGLITFGGMAAWFLVGRFVMKQLGLGMLRRK